MDKLELFSKCLNLVEGRENPESWWGWWNEHESEVEKLLNHGEFLKLKPRSHGFSWVPVFGSQKGAITILEKNGIAFEISNLYQERYLEELDAYCKEQKRVQREKQKKFKAQHPEWFTQYPKFSKMLAKVLDSSDEIKSAATVEKIVEIEKKLGFILPTQVREFFLITAWFPQRRITNIGIGTRNPKQSCKNPRRQMKQAPVGTKNARSGLRPFPRQHIMKLRLGLILLLFAASAGILVWMYYAATREPRSPKGSPWAETLADLDACCRRKHVKSVQYDHFAGIAADEKRHTAERLFRAMAFSERLQENNCATAILHLGGHYTPPGKIIIFGGTTDGNLERSVAYERQAHAGRSGADIRRAMERGNRYAARILTWASAGDMRNIALLERCRQEGRNAPDTGRFAVCPNCGSLYPSEYADWYCPACLTEGKRFVLFE